MKENKLYNSPGLSIAIIVVCTFAIYFNALFNGFVDDDHTAIIANTWLRDFSNIYALFHSSVWGFEEGREPSNYFRPFYSLVNMLEFQAFGLNPMGWHAVNVAFHAANSALVFLATRLLLGVEKERSNLFALFAGLVFAAHPIHTEVAAWASPIGELTFSFFFLASFIFYMKAEEAGGIKWRILSIAAFFLGTLCKETILTFLIFLPVYDILKPQGESLLRRIKYYVPYWAAAGVYFVMRMNAFGAIVPREPMHPYLSQIQYALNAVALMAKYMAATLLPINLSSFHPFEPIYSPMEFKFIISLMVVALVFIALIMLRKKDRLYALSLAAFVIPLFVVLYVPVLDRNTYTERYLYLSVFGFALLLVTAARHFMKAGVKPITIAFVVLVTIYSAATLKRNFEWKDDFTLWKATVKKDPDNYFILERLGRMYFATGDVNEAISLLERSVEANSARRDPDPRVLMFALKGLGDFYTIKNMPAEALDRYERAVELAPMRHDINMRLGNHYARLGDLLKAESHYLTALNGAENAKEAEAAYRALKAFALTTGGGKIP